MKVERHPGRYYVYAPPQQHVGNDYVALVLQQEVAHLRDTATEIRASIWPRQATSGEPRDVSIGAAMEWVAPKGPPNRCLNFTAPIRLQGDCARFVELDTHGKYLVAERPGQTQGRLGHAGHVHSKRAMAKTSDGVDLIRDAVRYVFPELIESESRSVIRAGPYEHSEDWVTERIGQRSRLVSTKAADVELAFPELRKGSFVPSILEPRPPIDQAHYAVVVEAYMGEISTRTSPKVCMAKLYVERDNEGATIGKLEPID